MKLFFEERIDRNDLPIQRIMEYIHKNFRQNLTLTYAAKKFALSPNYFCKIFSNSMGISFNSYLNSIRLKYVGALLVSTDKAIYEIAFESGYNSVEYFRQIFKKKFEVSST